MTSIDDRFASNFIRLVALADGLENRANSAVFAQMPGSKHRDRLVGIEFGEDALAAGSFQLGAAVNSLRALQLLTIQDVRQDALGGIKLTANITINGTVGLLRQALECATWANWLLEPQLPAETTMRGIAAAWLNGLEALKHERALDGPERFAVEAAMENLIADGRRLELIRAATGINPPWAPRRPMKDVTGLLRQQAIANLDRSEVVSELGPGVSNGEWVYRWLSGMAHGYAWVHILESAEGPLGEGGFVETTADWFRLSVSASLAIQMIDQAIGHLEVDLKKS